MKKLYLLLTLSFIFCCNTSFSVIRLVTNLGSSGPGSLNGEIIASGLGDTVLINVAGDLALANTLNISKSDLTIIGPYPAYFNITGSGFSGSLIDITGSSDLKIENIGFKGSGASCRAVRSSGNNGKVYFENCLFENFSNIGSDGGAIFYSGNSSSPFGVESCSFINNSTDLDGGAVYVLGGIFRSSNCTYFNNTATSATSTGGAVAMFNNYGGSNFIHNTFKDNVSQTDGTCVSLINGGGNVDMKGNAGAINGSPAISQFVGTGFLSHGGNVIAPNNGSSEPMPWGGPGDNSGFVQPFLHTSIVTDGYGLKYFTIVDSNSSYCGIVPAIGISPPLKDARRAPRQLSSNTPIGFDPAPLGDAGACEYTLLRVTNSGGDDNIPGRLPWAVKMNYNLENYIEFDLPLGFEINPVQPILETGFPTYIDGYSLTGTRIPGPESNSGTGLQGGHIEVNVVNPSSFHQFGLQFVGAAGSVISGVRVTEFNEVGVLVAAPNTRVIGCQIGIDAGQNSKANLSAGVRVNSTDCRIGGFLNSDRNVISGNGVGGALDSVNIDLLGTSNIVLGNIIGLDTSGFSFIGGGVLGAGGIRNSGLSNQIGGYAPLDGNTISGNSSFGILEASSGSTLILRNKIGVDFKGNSAQPNHTGIRVDGANNVYIGGNQAEHTRNIISSNGFANIHFIDGDDHFIEGNYIGLESTGTASLNISNYGILVDGAAVNAIHIGDGTDDGRNIISGNDKGVAVNASGGQVYVHNNYIGTDHTGTSSVGNNIGVYLGLAAASCEIGQPNQGNLISDNSNAGIFIDSANSQLIQSNIIGLDESGLNPLANGTGIIVEGGGNNTIGGDSLAGQGNLITSNSANGILVTDFASTTDIFGNHIGLTADGSSAPGNGINGLKIENVNNTIVGGSGSYANVISGHLGAGKTGVFCEFSGFNSVFENNYIGTDITGTLAFGNETGVRITDDHDVQFGTGATGTENYVCASAGNGVHILSPNVLLDGFFIGVGFGNSTGSMGNGANGILVEAPTVKIGLSSAPENVIINNGLNGILINGDAADSTEVGHTLIGITNGGTILGNGAAGIRIIDGDNNTIGVESNTIVDSPKGIYITGTAFDNHILKNTIGNTTGNIALANIYGIQIDGPAGQNEIGDLALSNHNIIGGNDSAGVYLNGSDDNIIRSNYIGIDNSNASIPNGKGIQLDNSDNNIIGFSTLGVGNRNFISNNTNQGILLDQGSNTNQISFNRIGVNVTGNSPAGNLIGIEIKGSSEQNEIGGDLAFNLGNTISANNLFGVLINQADSNYVSGNIIGMTGGNTTGMGIQKVGVGIMGGSKGNAVGGERWIYANHIAGNDSTGILIENADGNLVGGNVIGADGGTPSQKFGIVLRGSGTNNNIIGEMPKSVFGNIIYQNTESGIRIESNANNNTISSNIIGLDSMNTFSGTVQQSIGVEITPSAGYSPVGLSTAGAENVISANNIGILINGNSNQDIVNNLIGTDTTGLLPRGNTSAGIEISNGAASNNVGGVNPFHRNVISGNDIGVRIEDNFSNGNDVINNVIGMDILLGDSIPNNTGVGIISNAQGNTIGGSGTNEGNIISGNFFGVAVGNAQNNDIYGNSIGLLNSNVYGVVLSNGATGNNVGGALFGQRNVISGNDSIGVGFQASGGNTVAGNIIGLSANGTTAVPNLIGMYFDNSSTNQIGDVSSGGQNVISANTVAGIILENSSNGNVFENNFIGTDTTGNLSPAGYGNETGVFIIGSQGNQFGGDWQANEGNVVAGNTFDGIHINSSTANTVNGNNIGLSKDNNLYIPNGDQGVSITGGSTGNFIGTAGIGFENVITANGNSGIYVKNSSSNIIENNYIGNDELGGQGTVSNPAVNNQLDGIKLDTGSVGNFIIGKNIVSGNTNSEIVINGPGTSQNTVQANHIGVDFDGSVGYSNASAGVYILGGANSNFIGGSNSSERNIFGGDITDYVKIFGADTDSNRIEGNYIGLGLDGITMYSSASIGVAVLQNAEHNFIGGGLPNEGNTIVGLSSYGILIANAPNNRVFGNEIGIKPDGTSGTIDSVGVSIQNSNATYVGGLLVGSDSANVITNCDGGVDVTDWLGLGSSYGCPIIGNSIYNNTHLGIDIHGDNMVLPNDTNNFNFDNNGLIDAPEIFEAWNCGGGGTTHLAFKYFSSNAIGTYRIDVYENTVPDANGYGEGEIFIGSYPFNPANPYDTIDIDLGVVLPVGTIIAATMTGTAANTSEFSLNDTVTVAPTFNVASIEDESCFGANNGYIVITDAKPLTASIDGGVTNIYGPDTIFASTGTHTVEATYVNGCVLSQTVTINAGLALPFTYSFAEDTCGLGVGTILIDTTSTNAGGGSNNYTYSFSNGAAYNGPIDTLNIMTGTYSIGLYDNSLGCFSQIETFTVGEITDVADESFTFADFCPNYTPLPVITGDTGGTWTCSNGSIDSSTGEILSPTPGNTYTVTYTVGVCNEFSTIDVTAANFDDSTFTYDDFCEGTVPNSPVATTPGGTWSLVSGIGTIDANTGVLTAAQGNYNVQYTTNGTCPTSMTQLVTVFDQPTAPQIITADSIYCPDEIYAEMSSSLAGDSYSWYDSSDHLNVLANTSTYTPVSLTIGNNYYYLTITNAAGCESKHDSINYISADVSAMQADPDIETCLSSTVTLGASGGTEYLWNSDMQIISALDLSNPSATIGFETEFIVRITDIFNCIVMDTLKVTLLPSDSCFVEVYNAFSPNNDGTNDFWLIDGIEGFEENHVYVYNRWGDVIIDFVNYDNSTVVWNGDNKSNKPLPAGTYFYVVEVGGSQNSAGWIQLVK